jgi:hypothetical protein
MPMLLLYVMCNDECVAGLSRLCVMAERNIYAGEQLLYWYGDTSKEALQNNEWLILINTS